MEPGSSLPYSQQPATFYHSSQLNASLVLSAYLFQINFITHITIFFCLTLSKVEIFKNNTFRKPIVFQSSDNETPTLKDQLDRGILSHYAP